LAVQTSLSEIYNHALSGQPDLINKIIDVQPNIQIRECPLMVNNNKYCLSDVRKVAVMNLSSKQKIEQVDIASGQYIVMTQKRADSVDAFTPHVCEQYKWSSYLSSGLQIRDAQHASDTTVFTTTKTILVEHNKAKQYGMPFVLLSPKEFKGDDQELPADVLHICGSKLLKFARGFLSHVSFPLN